MMSKRILFFAFSISFLIISSCTQPLSILYISEKQEKPETQPTLEEALIAEMNLVRSDPRGYISKIVEYRALYTPYVSDTHPNKATISPPYLKEEYGVDFLIRWDGTPKVDILINYLETVASAPPLTLDATLGKAAKDHCSYLLTTASIGHNDPRTPEEGGNGAYAWDRVRKYSSDYDRVHENVAKGPFPYNPDLPRYLIIAWMVEDNYPGTGHRDNIMSPLVDLVGISVQSMKSKNPAMKKPDNITVAVYGSKI